MMDHSLPQLCSDDTCTGCGACASVCEKEAIQLLPNEEGFYRPQIDSSKCVSCGLCEKICPVLNPLKDKSSYADSLVYAAWNKDEKVRAESSSGGAFSALADTVLEMGGVVCGAAYMNDMSVEHICIENKADLPKLRLSKYVQSYTGRVFRQIQKYARQGKPVLFCGTPCQTAGLISFLRKDYPNVYVCDFICHGVPSPYMYKRYLDWVESRYGKVVHVNFRHKKKGWYDALRVMTFKDGRQKAMKGKNDAYWVPFNNNNNLQLSCYDCRFLGFPRKTDITIADFWGIGKNYPFGHIGEIEKGVSLLIGNSEKGISLIRRSEDKMMCFERTLDEAIEKNQAGVHSCARPASRENFYHDLSHFSFDEMLAKYMTPTVKIRLVKFFREYLPFSLIKYIRTRGQK